MKSKIPDDAEIILEHNMVEDEENAEWLHNSREKRDSGE